jgi:hypothetical protein
MTDAIDRKHDNIGTADETREKSRIVFEAPVMVQEAAIGPLHESLPST